VEVLRQLDLTIHWNGEFLVLVGSVGLRQEQPCCGSWPDWKPPSSARLLVGDRAVTGLRPAQRNVAMVFQSYASITPPQPWPATSASAAAQPSPQPAQLLQGQPASPQPPLPVA